MKTVFKFKEVMQLYRCNNYTQFDRLRKKHIAPDPDIGSRLYSKNILEQFTPGLTAHS